MQASDSTSPIILAFHGDPALPVNGAERLEGGLPVRRFRKELIRVGRYKHPTEGYEFDVTPETLKHWAVTFSAMHAAGVKIPAPEKHPKDGGASPDPSNNRGWLVGLLEDGKSLFGDIDLVGEGIKLAGTSDVSIYSPPEHRDSAGNVWKRPIMHVALCTDPVITGLSGFVPIVASQGQQPVNVPVLKLQTEGSSMPDMNNPNANAAAGGDPSEAIIQAIVDKVIALVKDASQTAQQKKAAFGDLMKRLEKALGVFDGGGEPAKPDAAAADAAGAGAGSGQPVAASHGTKPVAVDPMILKLSRKSRKQDLESLVAASKITPAVRDKLAAQWIPSADEALSLSLSQAGCDQFDSLVAALAENDPVQLGEKTRGQAVVLSHGLSGSPSPEEKKIRDEMAADVKRMAGIK